MKTRCLILVVLMIVLAFAMYQFGMKVAIPYLVASNDDTIIAGGLVFGIAIVIAMWVLIGEFLMKTLKCEKIIDKIFEDTEK